jgi:hypothetical protein
LYVWNENYFNSEACNGNDQIFHGVPREFKVFHAPDGEPHPRFRFPPSRLMASGLVTNRYGFRGLDFPPERSPTAIRFAFIGSSGTVAQHDYPLSYPEYFGFWLEKWLRAQGYDLHVQVLNSGREGIGTTDVRAVLEQEVLPLRPDYVMFYDGANQLSVSDDLLKSAAPLQRASHINGQPAKLLPGWLLKHSHAAELVDRYYRRFVGQLERGRPRPDYVLELPAGLDENHPDVDSPNLPLGLPIFVHDVEQMAADSLAAGTRFAMSTLPWLDGSELAKPNDPRYANMTDQLDTLFWPLRSPDIRRLIELQNRVLRRLAESRDVPLLDVAASYPLNPDLFLDMYHHNQDGIRLHAWIALQQFLPVLQHDLDQGLLASLQAASSEQAHSADLRSFVVHPQCGPTAQMLSRARNMQIRRITQIDPKAVMSTAGAVLTIRSSRQPWTYAGRLDLNANCLPGGGWLTLNAKLSQGTAAIGVLNKRGDGFIVRQVLRQTDGTENIMLKIAALAQTSALIVQNGADPSASEVEISDIRLISDGDGAVPVCPIFGKLADTEHSTSPDAAEFSGAQIVPGAADIGAFVANVPGAISMTSGVVTIVPPAQQWAYGAVLPIRLRIEPAKQGWVRVDTEVSEGNIGFGLLDVARNAFVTRVLIGPTDGVVSIVLPLPDRQAEFSLVVENAALPPAISKVMIRSVDVLVRNQ